MEMISWREFEKVELRVGRIIQADRFPEARKPAYILHVDLGQELGVKKSTAQITDLYEPQDLIGKLVVALVNLPPKQIGPVTSECLVTGFSNQNGEIVLCVPDYSVPLGTKIS